MKLAISVAGKTFDSPFDARFGRVRQWLNGFPDHRDCRSLPAVQCHSSRLVDRVHGLP